MSTKLNIPEKAWKRLEMGQDAVLTIPDSVNVKIGEIIDISGGFYSRSICTKAQVKAIHYLCYTNGAFTNQDDCWIHFRNFITPGTSEEAVRMITLTPPRQSPVDEEKKTTFEMSILEEIRKTQQCLKNIETDIYNLYNKSYRML